MYKNLLLYFLIVTFFISCTPNRLKHYAKEFETNTTISPWNALLIAPNEYPADTSLQPLSFKPFLLSFQKQNPGFINLEKFSEKLPEHELSKLTRWYCAYFYQKDKTLNYMALEFKTLENAKSYLKFLRTNKDDDALKILRFENIIIVAQVRSMKNELFTKKDASSLYEWIQNKQSKLSSEL